MNKLLLSLMLCFGIYSSAQAQSVLVSSGPELNLVEVSPSGIQVVDTASVPADEVLNAHQIFSIKRHPTNGLIYTSSANSCFDGELFCWGNARIDKFEVTNNQVTWVGPAYVMDNAAFLTDGITCAEGDEDSTGYPGQEGFCQPTNMVFSDDGTRLYIDDDELDGIQIFAVGAATGNLTFLAEGASTSNHGLAFQGTRLYNGESVISIAGDVPTDVNSSDAGNATEILPDGTLVSAINNNSIEAFDLADPDLPASINALNLGGGTALDTARTNDASLFILSGREVLTTVSWDGSAFAELDQVATPGDGLGQPRANRGVVLLDGLGATRGTGGELLAVVAYFQAEDDADYGTAPTGTELWSIDPVSGAMTELDGIELDAGWSRAALVVGRGSFETQAVPVNSPWALLLLIGLLVGLASMRLRFS